MVIGGDHLYLRGVPAYALISVRLHTQIAS
jgi:hypothetical protein